MFCLFYFVFYTYFGVYFQLIIIIIIIIIMIRFEHQLTFHATKCLPDLIAM